MYNESPESQDDRQYYDYHLDRNGKNLEEEVKHSSPVDIVYGIAIFVMITIMLLGMVLWAIGY